MVGVPLAPPAEDDMKEPSNVVITGELLLDEDASADEVDPLDPAGAALAAAPPVLLVPIAGSGAPLLAIHGTGSTGFPLTMIPKWRWTPVTFPVAPSVPSGRPAHTGSPGLTRTEPATMWA